MVKTLEKQTMTDFSRKQGRITAFCFFSKLVMSYNGYPYGTSCYYFVATRAVTYLKLKFRLVCFKTAWNAGTSWNDFVTKEMFLFLLG